jgi:hypothetical protein
VVVSAVVEYEEYRQQGSCRACQWYSLLGLLLLVMMMVMMMVMLLAVLLLAVLLLVVAVVVVVVATHACVLSPADLPLVLGWSLLVGWPVVVGVLLVRVGGCYLVSLDHFSGAEAGTVEELAVVLL